MMFFMLLVPLILQIVTYEWADGSTETEERRLADTEIIGQISRWEALPITEYVRKWIREDNTELQVTPSTVPKKPTHEVNIPCYLLLKMSYSRS